MPSLAPAQGGKAGGENCTWPNFTNFHLDCVVRAKLPVLNWLHCFANRVNFGYANKTNIPV